jgi:hypothetical protein
MFPRQLICVTEELLRILSKQLETIYYCVPLMMVVWPEHVVAITSEEEKKNCCVEGHLIALLTENVCFVFFNAVRFLSKKVGDY